MASMNKKTKRPLKVMIFEDDEDILTLYSDYLSNKGYHVVARYTKGNNIKEDLETDPPDVFLINSLLPGKKKWNRRGNWDIRYTPRSANIITADSEQPYKIEENPVFRDKRVNVLLKPVKLDEIEHSISNLVNK